MRKIIYNVLFLIGFALSCPYYTLRMWRRGRFFRSFGERLGCYAPEVRQKLAGLREPVWIHAVSVGEVMIAGVLVRELRKINPDVGVVISTTTVTGRGVAQKLEDDKLAVVYNPTDFFFAVRNAFRRIRPSLLILVEQEIWPNHIWQAEKLGVPVWLLNARLSDRSWSRMRRIRPLLEPILGKLSLVFLQDESDRDRFAQVGFPPHALFNLGSLKFEVAEPDSVDAGLSARIRRGAGWKDSDPVLFGGSTHPGEEQILLKIYQELKRKQPLLRLLLAPRHVERTKQVEQACRVYGFEPLRRSSLMNGVEPSEAAEVLILDTTGELRSIYDLGTVTFIGKSLAGKGGQNFLEAVRVGCPVVVGPNMQNFSRLAEYFLSRKAIRQVRDAAELGDVVRQLLEDADGRAALGRRGREFFEQNLGAGRKAAEAVSQYLAQRVGTA